MRYTYDIMTRAGRSCLLLLSFLSLQLSLFGGGSGCSVASTLAQVSGSAEMGEMVMATPVADQPDDASVQHDAQHHEQSCDGEGARTGTACDSMTVCAFAAVTSPTSVQSVRPMPPMRAPTLAVRTPPTDGDAPDLPPPRA